MAKLIVGSTPKLVQKYYELSVPTAMGEVLTETTIQEEIQAQTRDLVPAQAGLPVSKRIDSHTVMYRWEWCELEFSDNFRLIVGESDNG